MKTILKMLVAALVGLAMACVLIWHDASDNAVIGTFFTVAIAVALALGVFDMPERRRKVRHKTLSQGYRDAA